MTRGYVWAEYVDDLGHPWALQVDADYAADPVRGWAPIDLVDINGMPRGWRARRVWGYDADGHQREAICATVLCDLWTGVASSFMMSTTGNTNVEVGVVGRLAEYRTRPVLLEWTL